MNRIHILREIESINDDLPEEKCLTARELVDLVSIMQRICDVKPGKRVGLLVAMSLVLEHQHIDVFADADLATLHNYLTDNHHHFGTALEDLKMHVESDQFQIEAAIKDRGY